MKKDLLPVAFNRVLSKAVSSLNKGMARALAG